MRARECVFYDLKLNMFFCFSSANQEREEQRFLKNQTITKNIDGNARSRVCVDLSLWKM